MDPISSNTIEDAESGVPLGSERPVDSWGRWPKIIFTIIGFILLLLFGYSAAVQFNDKKAGTWIAFYALHALLAFIMLVVLFKSLPAERPVLFTCMGLMMIWSLVFIGITADNLVDHDMSDELTQQERIFELSGAILTGINIIYHALLLDRCTRKRH